MLARTIYVILGCDVDQDRNYFIADIPDDEMSWRGMLEGIPHAKERLRGLTDSNKQSPVFTWNIRADYQIKKIYGTYSFILEKHTSFFRELEQSGDELSWHPHFWFYNEQRKIWYQHYQDVDWQQQMLEDAYSSYQKVLPGRAKSVRMGWSYHNNRTFATLDKLGLQVDISANPGLKILPPQKQVYRSNFYDWYITPDKPYFPSTVDYRRESKGDESSYSVLEVPNFVADTFFWGLISGMVLAKKMKDIKQMGYALSKQKYLATITSKPRLFKPMITQMKKKLESEETVVYCSLLHPDELIENIHPVYSLENMEKNMKSIRELADSMHAKMEYVKACAMKSIFG